MGDRLDKHTPYGARIVQREVRAVANTYMTIDSLNPHAWLYHTCETIPAYAAFLARYANDTLNVVFYDDENKLGNVLRPRLAMSFNGLYWIAKEFMSACGRNIVLGF